eukprot:751161-Hanusia_phi.AAC.2
MSVNLGLYLPVAGAYSGLEDTTAPDEEVATDCQEIHQELPHLPSSVYFLIQECTGLPKSKDFLLDTYVRFSSGSCEEHSSAPFWNEVCQLSLPCLPAEVKIQVRERCGAEVQAEGQADCGEAAAAGRGHPRGLHPLNTGAHASPDDDYVACPLTERAGKRRGKNMRREDATKKAEVSDQVTKK